MATLTFNSALTALSGTIDNWVYRTRRDGTVVVAARPRPSHRAPSPAQLAHRERFTRAALYARSACEFPAAHAFYAPFVGRKGRSVYAVASADYFHAPVIHAIDPRDYHAREGDPIVVLAEDNIAVTAVGLRLLDQDGRLIEEGTADSENGCRWHYAARATVTEPGPLLIEATAYDRAGNATIKTHATPEEVLS